MLTVENTGNDLVVRAGVAADAQFIVDANAAMALETEHKTLDRATLERGVAAVLADSTRGLYLVAERGSLRLGCLMITREWSDWRNGEWWWLQSVYVDPAARRKGVFRALFADVERLVRAAPDVIGVRLYVERNNRNAQAVYATLGLHDAGYVLLERYRSMSSSV